MSAFGNSLRKAVPLAFLLDDFVGAYQKRLRNLEAQCPGSLAVDHQFKFRGLLDGQVTRLGAFENLVHIVSGTPGQVVQAHAVGHQTPGFHEFRPVVYHWKPALYSEFSNLCSLSKKDGTSQNEDCASAPFARGLKCGFNIL